MNNSMQNILLQELETFEGILFATSNLNVNLDKAFERRFPYKIHFRKPDVATREKIWATKLPDLEPPAVATLAQGFELTGGQIDNIVRKYLLHNILNDNPPDLGQIEQMCTEETLHGPASRIGF
jgi:SpoVK/Ycf46/Vps4 family AAA+-type ATPase